MAITVGLWTCVFRFHKISFLTSVLLSIHNFSPEVPKSGRVELVHVLVCHNMYTEVDAVGVVVEVDWWVEAWKHLHVGIV